ncbi:MAG: hypothetical protein ACLQE9_11200 [Roseiarcus sp.]
MTTLPADEDYAKAILAIFQARGVRPRQTLNAEQVESEFVARHMGRRPDYEAGLDYAMDRHWLTLELNAIRLTEAGRDEA